MLIVAIFDYEGLDLLREIVVHLDNVDTPQTEVRRLMLVWDNTTLMVEFESGFYIFNVGFHDEVHVDDAKCFKYDHEVD